MALHDVELIWAQRYRPRTIDDVILPAPIKREMKGVVESGLIPNMIFSGSAGVGKTTVALALCDELGYDCLFMNMSGEDRGIDAVKRKIGQFATTASMDGSRRCVILDEADNMTHDAQLALRAMIEAVSTNCSFILTCNYPNRINEAIQSRCPVTEFSISPGEAEGLMLEMFKKATQILDETDTQYEKSAIAKLVKANFPDFRKTINALQKASNAGVVDSSSIQDVTSSNMEDLVSAMKAQNIGAINTWIAESVLRPVTVINWFNDPKHIGTVFKSEEDHVAAAFKAAEYDRYDSMVTDQINNLRAFVYFLTNAMKGKWK